MYSPFLDIYEAEAFTLKAEQVVLQTRRGNTEKMAQFSVHWGKCIDDQSHQIACRSRVK